MSQWEIIVAALAVLAGVWGHLRSVGSWLQSLIVVRHWVDWDIAKVVSSYLATRGRHHAREGSFGTTHAYVKPLRGHYEIAFEYLPAHQRMMWNGGRPLWIDKVKSPDDEDYPFTVSFVRGTINWVDLLRDALAWSQKFGGEWETVRHQIIRHHGRTLGAELSEQRERQRGDTKSRQVSWDPKQGRRLLHWREEDLGEGRGEAFAEIALTPDLRALLDEVRLWYASQDWYRDHGVSWRRGYLHHGAPGTGKTSFARAEAEDLDLPVHVMDVATMSNEDLCHAWDKATADTPCMILIEDIDAVFRGRDNVARSGGMMASGGLTFDCLLGCIDGIQRATGVLIVITTNHLDQIDSALRRAGRIDRVVEFLPIDHDGRLAIARRIIGSGPEAERLAIECDGWTAAQYTEECVRSAIAARFGDRNNDPYR